MCDDFKMHQWKSCGKKILLGNFVFLLATFLFVRRFSSNFKIFSLFCHHLVSCMSNCQADSSAALLISKLPINAQTFSEQFFFTPRWHWTHVYVPTLSSRRGKNTPGNKKQLCGNFQADNFVSRLNLQDFWMKWLFVEIKLASKRSEFRRNLNAHLFEWFIDESKRILALIIQPRGQKWTVIFI